MTGATRERMAAVPQVGRFRAILIRRAKHGEVVEAALGPVEVTDVAGVTLRPGSSAP